MDNWTSFEGGFGISDGSYYDGTLHAWHNPRTEMVWSSKQRKWIPIEEFVRGPSTPTQEGTTVTAYSLTVNREKLIGLLEKRRTEIDTFYDEKKKEVEDRLALAKTPEKAWSDWYKQMAKRLDEGTLIVVLTAGAGRKVQPAPGAPEKPPTPEVVDVTSLDAELNGYEDRRLRTRLPYDTAIDMLQIAVGDEVEIPVSEYEVLIKKPQTLY